MKKPISGLFIALIALCVNAQTTNVLTLTWFQPVGFQSTLYESTNLSGAWGEFGVVNPPVSIQETNQVSFFTVIVMPTNFPTDYVNYPGPPTNNPPSLLNVIVDSTGQQWEFFNGQWQ